MLCASLFPARPMRPIRPGGWRRIRSLIGGCLAAVCLSLLSGCYDENMGPMPHDLVLSNSQPGGSYRLGAVDRTEYTVHLFWGIWTPKKKNSWATLESEVKGKGADGIYDVQIKTYMPWWHVFLFVATSGFFDLSAHEVKCDTYAFSKPTPALPPAPAPAPTGAPSPTSPTQSGGPPTSGNSKTIVTAPPDGTPSTPTPPPPSPADKRIITAPPDPPPVP